MSLKKYILLLILFLAIAIVAFIYLRKYTEEAPYLYHSGKIARLNSEVHSIEFNTNCTLEPLAPTFEDEVNYTCATGRFGKATSLHGFFSGRTVYFRSEENPRFNCSSLDGEILAIEAIDPRTIKIAFSNDYKATVSSYEVGNSDLVKIGDDFVLPFHVTDFAFDKDDRYLSYTKRDITELKNIATGEVLLKIDANKSLFFKDAWACYIKNKGTWRVYGLPGLDMISEISASANQVISSPDGQVVFFSNNFSIYESPYFNRLEGDGYGLLRPLPSNEGVWDACFSSDNKALYILTSRSVRSNNGKVVEKYRSLQFLLANGDVEGEVIWESGCDMNTIVECPLLLVLR